HLEQVRRAVEAAADLGADVVNISLSMPTLPGPDRPPLRGCDVPDDEHRRAADLVRDVGEKAGSVGVRLAVELHDDGLLDTAGLLLRLVGRVGLPNVGVNPDLGNVCRGPGEPPDWRAALERLAPRATNWHVKNYRAGEPAPIWDGVIDYAAALPVMRGAGY